MISDPINIAAHNIFSNKGVFALLLGSGLSRSAEIPTGWEITLDLIRQIAVMENGNVEDDPEKWFIEKKGKEPDYSELLSALSGTAGERQGILNKYIEPTEEDRQEGRKIPTKAHNAIARLVEKGFVRVIITTNFDRLLENALQKCGIEPIIISSEDDVKGAPPLTHGRCFIIKVHGDYLDTRIKNTAEELEDYSKEMNQYLDQVFDQFGLIICGWSGVWDEALRKAIRRCPTRRFSTFWTVRGKARSKASELIKKRDAKVIVIEDADTFFDQLAEKVEALEEISRPAPTDIRMATTMVKRYLSEDKYRIRLQDTILNQTKQTLENIQKEELKAVSFTPEEFIRRLKLYEGKTEIIRAIASVGAFYSRPEQTHLWIDVVKRLYNLCHQYRDGNTFFIDLQRYPALITFYTLGISALAGGNYDLLSKMFETVVEHKYEENLKTIDVLLPYTFGDSKSYADMWKNIKEYERNYFPMSEYLHNLMQSSLTEIEPDEKMIELYFDRFELLAALAFGYSKNQKDEQRYWFPVGRYVYLLDRGYNAVDLTSFLNEADTQKDEWAPIKSGMFGGKYDNFKIVKDAFIPFVQEVARSRW